jgi:hypothetical protein
MNKSTKGRRCPYGTGCELPPDHDGGMTHEPLPCFMGETCPLPAGHDGMVHLPTMHQRREWATHRDREACERPQDCTRDHLDYGACTCSPNIHEGITLAFQRDRWEKHHPTERERAMAAWLAEAPAALDPAAWKRVAAGAREAMRAAAEAWEEADAAGVSPPSDPDSSIREGLVVGYLTAVAALRGIGYDREAATMWALRDEATPGTFLDYLITQNTAPRAGNQ